MEKLHETGVHAVSITSDGPSTHLAMMSALGAKLDPENMRPFFPHPCNPEERVHVLLDIAHMVKLIRNSLASESVINSPSGEVKWEFIVKLHQLQEKEGLRAGTKLKRQHIEWERSKMKVNLAAQTLSASVADALDFLREDLRLDEFQGSAPTSEFVRLFDSLFDVFNSKSQFGKKFKAPMSMENQESWSVLFSRASDYIRSLTRQNGTSVLSSRIKTGFLGFLCGISSFQNLFEDLVQPGHLQYILTYKFSQVFFKHKISLFSFDYQ